MGGRFSLQIQHTKKQAADVFLAAVTETCSGYQDRQVKERDGTLSRFRIVDLQEGLILLRRHSNDHR